VSHSSAGFVSSHNMHSDELHILYSSANAIGQIKSRRMRWAGLVARIGSEREVYKVLVGKPEGKRPLVRPRRRWDQDGSWLGECRVDPAGSG
jgi:hypothetical protein